MSSDGNGAPPKEAKGENKPRVANYMPLSALHGMWRQLVREEGIALDTALSTVTILRGRPPSHARA
jgi:beta-aspartyl-dipeptidase (metallo-type)